MNSIRTVLPMHQLLLVVKLGLVQYLQKVACLRCALSYDWSIISRDQQHGASTYPAMDVPKKHPGAIIGGGCLFLVNNNHWNSAANLQLDRWGRSRGRCWHTSATLPSEIELLPRPNMMRWLPPCKATTCIERRTAFLRSLLGARDEKEREIAHNIQRGELTTPGRSESTKIFRTCKMHLILASVDRMKRFESNLWKFAQASVCKLLQSKVNCPTSGERFEYKYPMDTTLVTSPRYRLSKNHLALADFGRRQIYSTSSSVVTCKVSYTTSSIRLAQYSPKVIK